MNGFNYSRTGYPAYGAAAAYDPDLGAIVLFGGCSAQCPSNQTWLYAGSIWFNATETNVSNPPPLFGASMAWDPAWDGVLLVGGVGGRFAAASNQTWLYDSSGWVNLTGQVGFVGDPPAAGGVVYGAMAWDDQTKQMLLVDGCPTGTCTTAWNAEWILNDTAWRFVSSGPTDSTGVDQKLWNASMAYDPSAHEMVFFGGQSLGRHGNATNLTFVLGSNGTWSNVTNGSSTCRFNNCSYPGPRASAAMTWDGQKDAILLFGGNDVSGAGPSPLNDTWYFAGGLWVPVAGPPTSRSPPDVYGAAMPSNSSSVAPLLVGGICVVSCLNQSWVFEILPQPQIYRVSPNPADFGAIVNISAATPVGTGSGGPSISAEIYDNYGNEYTASYGPVTFSSNQSFQTNFSYFIEGTWNLTAAVIDYYGIGEFSPVVPVVVGGNLSIAPVATPNPAEVGSPVAFNAHPSLGEGAYSYGWNFLGTGPATSLQPTPTHTYGAAGTYPVWVNVTDAGGGWNNSTFLVTVVPALSVTAGTNLTTTTDVGVAVGFSAAPAGGSENYTGFSWSFGDGTTAVGRSPSHIFGSTGMFVVNVTVTDSYRFSAKGSTPVHVVPDPTVAIHASTTAPQPGNSVVLGAGINGGTGPFTYRWNLGDGTTSTSNFVEHSYASAGTYTVSLKVVDRYGRASETNLTLTVSPLSLLGELTQGLGLYLLLGGLAAAATGVMLWTFWWPHRKGRGGAPPAPTLPRRPIRYGPTRSPGAPPTKERGPRTPGGPR
jgi:PKD repeat protein